MNWKLKKIFLLSLLFLTFQNCKTTKTPFVFSNILWTVAWSPDGQTIAVGGNNNELKLLSPKKLKPIKSFKKPNTITKLKWHPDGKSLAIARQWNDESDSSESNSQIMNIANNSFIDLKISGIRGLAWSPDGNFLAVGNMDGTLFIFTKNGKLDKKIKTNQKAITALSWHPTKKLIATVGSHIVLVDILKKSTTEIIPRDKEILMLSVEWHPFDDFFVTGDYGNSDIGYLPLLQFWNSQGKKIREVEGSEAEYRNLKWTSDGELLATASDKVRLWSKQGKLTKERSLGNLLWGIDWNSDDSKLVVTSGSGEVTILKSNLKKIKCVEIKNIIAIKN